MGKMVLSKCLYCHREHKKSAFSRYSFCTPECRFLHNANWLVVGECWEWQGSTNPQTGYGQISVQRGGKTVPVSAHRMSYMAHIGTISKGHIICHSCDNRLCVNPEHLWEGTQNDNIADMIKKGRGRWTGPKTHWTKLYPEKIKRGSNHPMFGGSMALPKGENHHNAKLTDEDVRLIRSSQESPTTLSKKLSVSPTTICDIRRNRTWLHVD